MIKLKYYSDPGHGWVAVKRKLLNEYSLADKITSFSYQKGDTVYLEEDKDAYLFVEELKRNNIVVEYITKHTNNRSPIRNYQHYEPV